MIETIMRGSLIRLRPVLMTALVAAFGFIPMATHRHGQKFNALSQQWSLAEFFPQPC